MGEELVTKHKKTSPSLTFNVVYESL